MKQKEVMIGVMVLYILALISAYSTSIVPAETRLLVQDFLFLIAPLAASVMGILTLRKFGMKSTQGKIILFLSLGFLMWLFAEIMWIILEIILKVDSFPSVADAIFLAAYLMFAIGIVLEIKLGQINWISKRTIISSMVILVLCIATYYFELYQAYNAQASFAENAISLAYGIADLVVLVLILAAVNLSFEFKGGSLQKFWIVMSLAFIMQWVTDILFAIYYNQYTQPVWFYRQIDYLWVIMYMTTAYAFFRQITSLDEIVLFMKNRKPSEKSH